MDSLKHGWTAEELCTINIWANNLFAAGEGRNWGKGKTIPKDLLEQQIAMMSNPEILYQVTALRLMREGGLKPLQIYHQAIKAVRGELPEYAYEISEGKELTEDLRRKILSESEKMISGLIKNQKEYIQYDRRAEEAVDLMEPTMRTPEIKVMPTEETLRNQESSDFIALAGSQESTFEVREETRRETQSPNRFKIF